MWTSLAPISFATRPRFSGPRALVPNASCRWISEESTTEKAAQLTIWVMPGCVLAKVRTWSRFEISTSLPVQRADGPTAFATQEPTRPFAPVIQIFMQTPHEQKGFFDLVLREWVSQSAI